MRRPRNPALVNNCRRAVPWEERLKAPPSVFDAGNKDTTQQLKATSEELEQVLATQRELNHRVFARARAVLSPDQMNILETAQKQQLEVKQMEVTLGKQFVKTQEK